MNIQQISSNLYAEDEAKTKNALLHPYMLISFLDPSTIILKSNPLQVEKNF